MRSISFSWKNMITNNVKEERELKQRAKYISIKYFTSRSVVWKLT